MRAGTQVRGTGALGTNDGVVRPRAEVRLQGGWDRRQGSTHPTVRSVWRGEMDTARGERARQGAGTDESVLDQASGGRSRCLEGGADKSILPEPWPLRRSGGEGDAAYMLEGARDEIPIPPGGVGCGAVCLGSVDGRCLVSLAQTHNDAPVPTN